MAKLASRDEWKLWVPVAAIIVIAIVWLYFASRPPTEGGERLWRVEKVIDAHTLALKGSGKSVEMKLVGLEVPDSQMQAAKDFLTETVEKQWVRAKFLRDGPGNTKEGFVYLSAVDVNARMIRQGLAKIDQNEKDPDVRPYLELEQEAKSKMRGLWSSPAPGSPAK
ncbi:MAG: thermonuclease family protein [Thermodesulfobacteriota bacterium]